MALAFQIASDEEGRAVWNSNCPAHLMMVMVCAPPLPPVPFRGHIAPESSFSDPQVCHRDVGACASQLQLE